MNESNCPMWDELHQCCMFERMETIWQLDGEDRAAYGDFEKCFSELD